MRSYRTEILIPPDRQIHLQLPDHLPEGRALLIVELIDPESTPKEPEAQGSPDRPAFNPDDFEWWDEFEDRPDR